MKFLFIAILSFFFSGISFAQEIFTNRSEAENKYKDSLKEGKWIEYYNRNGQVVNDNSADYYRLTIYKAGKPDGKVREYFDARHIKTEMTYVNGKLNGTVKQYFESGKLYREIPYFNGYIDGYLTEYYESGKKKSVGYYQLSKRVLHEVIYYPNGKKQQIRSYANDTLNGITTDYKDGDKWKETPYKQGIIDGTVKVYYEYGELWKECPYVKGVENGVEKWYSISGKIKSEIPYVNGKINGVAKEYYPGGYVVECETTYSNGEKVSTKKYDEKGNEIK